MTCSTAESSPFRCLQDAIDEVQQQATAEGAFGRGTSRYLEPARPDLQLPEGAAWTTVRVK